MSKKSVLSKLGIYFWPTRLVMNFLLFAPRVDIESNDPLQHATIHKNSIASTQSKQESLNNKVLSIKSNLQEWLFLHP